MLNEIEQATARLLETAGRLTDADVRQPSLLPGWTRAHVLAHVARGGTALRNILVDEAPYASQEARNADIEAGSGRTAAELVADVEATAQSFRDTVATVPEERWEDMVSILGFAPFPKRQVLLRRLVELELHHVDLGAGYTRADWPAFFAELDLPEPMRTQRADRG
ncbi:maleylpyruvate isomerase family mycothiol-dependent enzyme [Nucisporomicrobium flavum]|jgi:maleylpyruvate isomerase|uniref:maleylpyruvate isomerase family mycothiol-dependent enzyme n=1 Tax=Nucisporomicrobium flavum TaxID=2785915 RepID=UPI0018F331E5|nr:maleylpyruvate isomerase family mycothiol-dependent enzyme [Nucisporomicrobium flavum]